MERTIRIAVKAEETVYSGRYSNNGANPMWCYGTISYAKVKLEQESTNV